MTNYDDLREIIEARFAGLTQHIDLFTQTAQKAVASAQKAADRALELAARIVKLEEKYEDLELRVRALERGGTFEDEED